MTPEKSEREIKKEKVSLKEVEVQSLVQSPIEKVISALSMGIFGSVGLTLLLLVSSLFLEETGDWLQHFSSSLSTCYIFVLIAGVWLFCAVFVSTRLVKPYLPTRMLAENFLEVNSFLAIFVSGLLCMHRIWCSTIWWWLIAQSTLGGLCAISHGWFLYFQRTRNSIAIDLHLLKENGGKNREHFTKHLELEHNFFQTYFQLFISATMIFITAGVAAYFLNSEQVSALSIQNAFLMGIWLIIGIFFGVLLPISKHMEYIRNTVRNVAIDRNTRSEYVQSKRRELLKDSED